MTAHSRLKLMVQVSMRLCLFSTADPQVRSGGGYPLWAALAWAATAAPPGAWTSSGGNGIAKGNGEISHQVLLAGFDLEQADAALVRLSWQNARWQSAALSVTTEHWNGRVVSSARTAVISLSSGATCYWPSTSPRRLAMPTPGALRRYRLAQLARSRAGACHPAPHARPDGPPRT